MKSLLNIILCISNYEEYQSELYSHNSLYIVIRSLAQLPEQDIAKRIWSNLQRQDDSESISDRIKKQKSPKIFISYNHNDKTFCENFVDKLSEHVSIPIWVDYQQPNEFLDPWECVNSAIDSATVIIVLVSSAYGQSINNFLELRFAMQKIPTTDKTESPLIVVEAVPDFELNEGWIGLLIGDMTTISYKDDIDQMIVNVINHGALVKYKRNTSVRPTPGNNAPSKVCTIM